MLDRTKWGDGAYSLREPLPSAVVTSSSGSLAGYRNYPIFSAPWFWRRTGIFAPIASAAGFLQAVLAGVELHDGRMGALCALVGVPIWLAIVTAGPAFATVVRHRHLPLHLERIAVVAAILLGVGVSLTGQHLANEFSLKVVAPRMRAALHGAADYTQRTPQPIVFGLVWFWETSIFFCLGGGLALRAYFSELRLWREVQHAREVELLRHQKSEADLRLTVLQAQVEPHFLFNTLASVHSLIRQDPQRAEATVEALVDHLRATMPKLRAGVGTTHSTLAEQVELCTSYLGVMQVRMGGRLRYTVDVPEGLRSHPFPPLMLISLVENAIKHGIEPSRTGGNIVLTAATETHADVDQLAVSVIDDGVGLRPGAGGGIGLENIRAQLTARFGAHGALVIRARTVSGVAATIRVPYAGQKT
jgi:two-component sensor histidine kinase